MDLFLYPKSPFSDSFAESGSARSETLSIASTPSIVGTPNLEVREPPKPQKLRFLDVQSDSSDSLSPFNDHNATFRPPGAARPPGTPLHSMFPPEDEPTEMKRLRWGTTRRAAGRPKGGVHRSRTLKQLFNRDSPSKKSSSSHAHGAKSSNNSSDSESAIDDSLNIIDDYGDDPAAAKDPKDRKSEERTLAFNRTLPQNLLDPETGLPAQAYPRNKIRTAKYTPLSFFPKNVWGQFSTDIANGYFLFVIILGVFPLFGVPSPVLAAVPLIFIVCVTALKDSIEDSQRTATDMEVNNQSTHILTQVRETALGFIYKNQNVCDENVSLWRQFKKWNTRRLFQFLGFMKRITSKKSEAVKLKSEASKKATTQDRKSFDSVAEFNRYSMVSIATHKTHKKPNSRVSCALSKTLAFSKKTWKEVRVGDIVRIQNNEEVPADVMILASSDEDNCCFVETKNLDGETNLKVKQAVKLTAESDLKRADDYMGIDFQIESEGPHPNLYLYQGAVLYDDDGVLGKEPVTINNMMLRGCFLRNTKWITGIVVFTGSDTKIMLNSGLSPTKKSRLSRELNYYVLLNFIILFIICFLSGLISGLIYRNQDTSREEFEFGTIAGTPAKNGLVNFIVAVILYQSLVPISLYITIEIIKLIQAYFIHCDVGLYYDKLDLPCNPKTWSISDDLGQVEYIFSDKTGTLTQNLMEFRKCTINGISYGRAYTEALAGLRRRQGVDVETESRIERGLIALDRVEMLSSLRSISSNIYDDDLTFVSKEFVFDLAGKSGDIQKHAAEEFMLALSLCHSILLEDDPKNPGKTLLKAQSPDEAALVGTARSLGFNFCDKTKRGYVVRIQGQKREYQVLNTLEFNSTRKRMSAIIKLPSDNDADEPRVVLYCKGADSIIYSRLLTTENDPQMLNETSQHLEGFATEGLRTLCIARRELTWAEYEEFNARHLEAAASLTDREAKMEEVADSIERELVLIGGTAIEDRLQDGVPESISTLAQAGIKLWVLTGDKVETAINIGFSCNLLGNDMELLVLKTDLLSEDRKTHSIDSGDSDVEIIDKLITGYLMRYFQMTGSIEELEEAMKDHSAPSEGFGVVIDGDALKLALADPEIQRKFLLLCKQCKAVLCCRVSPAQKAAVVKMVKDTLDVMTLAIGDGSNDVAMIQTADIGVGIAGEEGRQAAMSSDYAVGQFRFLTRLLLTHGRWSYKRFSEMIPCFFYKNINYTFSQFWFSFFCGFDGTYMFNVTYLMLYHVVFTSLPVITLGVFDQDVNAAVSMVTPQLYRSGILRSEFTESKFWIYLMDGIFQSLVSFFFPYLVYAKTFQTHNGWGSDHRFAIGILVATISCLSSNLYVLFHQYRWDWVSFLLVSVSILIIFLWTIIWTSGLWSSEFYDTGRIMFSLGTFWACFAIAVCVCLLPLFVHDVIQRLFYPTDSDLIRECVKRGDYKKYPDNYDPTDPLRAVVDDKVTEDLQASPDTSGTMASEAELTKRHSTILQRGQTKSIYHDNMSIIDTYNLAPTATAMTDEVYELKELKSNNLEKQKSHIRVSLETSDVTTAIGLRRSMDTPRPL
ncbi:hypothetical protein PUMCH_002525 [Australozyma saopauloensis]|uniref:Phospholipid-transporting ATPase n=1 Tax=Australozyma saopauloensis TaxID=291208 RepID=A0AAX4H9Z6_9ASCO|nr:hypothetical protein PUMCH_002525 [[Candida] saopauloensis]